LEKDEGTSMKKNHKLGIAIVLLLVLFLFAGALYSLRIISVQYSGNVRYSEEEMNQLLFKESYEWNPIYCFFASKYQKKKEIPFIETYDIEFLTWNQIKVTVYEKSIAGCVDYKGYYMYFDKDGIVVESSKELLEGVVKIEGLDFEHIVLHQVLPVEKEEVFNLILSLTQMLTKYQIDVDKISFDRSMNIWIYRKNIVVQVGKDVFLDEKMAKLKDMLPNLEGLSGTLYLDDFSEDTEEFRFKKDRE